MSSVLLQAYRIEQGEIIPRLSEKVRMAVAEAAVAHAASADPALRQWGKETLRDLGRMTERFLPAVAVTPEVFQAGPECPDSVLRVAVGNLAAAFAPDLP